MIDITTARRTISRLLAAIALAPLMALVASGQPENGDGRDARTVLGTWTGTSLCVGNRPACKNEEVVYRFVAVEGQPNQATLLADKIIDGQRVPMGKLQCDYKDSDRSLTCEFRIGQTHGIWAYTLSGETMTGTLVILPERSLGRRVNVHRVRDDQVPKAPNLSEY